jgi:hypothetical protein
MINLTYWQNPRIKRDPEDFDEIETIHLKSVKQIPDLLTNRPPHCTMISTEHSAERTLKNGTKTNFFKEIWRGDAKKHFCPTCGHSLR